MHTYPISPSDGPFKLMAWLELPFQVLATVNQAFPVIYHNVQTEMCIETISEPYLVVTGNEWLSDLEIETWFAQTLEGETTEGLSIPFIEHLYVSQAELKHLVAKLQADEQTPYIEPVPAVMQVTIPIPPELIPDKTFIAWNIRPQTDFFNSEVLRHLQTIIAMYRIAALPRMRYEISPISEALVDRAVVSFLNREDRVCGSYIYGFDDKSMSHYLSDPNPQNVQKRFERFMQNINDQQAEDQMASTYFLYRMRRWTEAVAVASAVVESLHRELVFKVASTPVEAEAIWRAYRYRELFCDILPQFGIPKLSDVDSALWQSYIKAREYRGAKVHGEHPDPFDREQEQLVKQHLTAFYEVARWLKGQLGQSWALDAYDEKGNRLDPFPH